MPVNTRFKSKEVSHILERSGARVAFTVGEFLGMNYAATLSELRPQLASLELVVGFDGASHVDDSLESFLRLGERVGDERARCADPRDRGPTTSATCCSRRERPVRPRAC